ncbi:3'-5' exonuclease [Pseudazoarcus pumilus]|nr:exonuclease domain-containing protein [Pseudazoarcus pumilus]
MMRRAGAALFASALVALMLAPLALVFGLFWQLGGESVRAHLIEAVHGRLGVVLFALVLLLSVGAMLACRLHRAHVRQAFTLAEEIELIAGAGEQLRIREHGPASLRAIERAVNVLAARREALRADVAEQVAQAQRSIEAERNRLAALMGELAQSVVVCNLDGRILLYNARAREQFRGLSASPQLADGSELIGLGRSIHAVFERDVIAHGLETVRRRLARGDDPAVANFVLGCGQGHLLRVRMSPVLAEGSREPDGFILLFDDITSQFVSEARRDRLMQSLTDDNRASLATLCAAAEQLAREGGDASQRARRIAEVRSEATRMGERFDTAAAELAEARRARWPLEEMHATDLVDAVRVRIAAATGVAVEVEQVDDVWLEADSFSLLQAVAFLAWRIREASEAYTLSLRLLRVADKVCLGLGWSGHPVSEETVAAWEIESMRAADRVLPTTVREVIERHGGEMRFERERARGRIWLGMMLREAVARPDEAGARGVPLADGRPEFYDFDIFDWAEDARVLDDTPLSALNYTAFDTETTGLDPSGGDEIIQIGATRIVNAKLLRGESFEQLIDPRRALRPESIAVHGIVPELLAGQPTIDAVLPAFRAFVADTVLVAHNAAFDMRFLQLKEASTDVVFDRPVLDTLLISALLHPNQESHRLESIAERLGVTVSARHTALGDAIVTAEVFIRMLPLLAERGIRTLGELREASERTFYARIRY